MLSIIAGVLTVASVFLAGKKTIWAWPIGFVAAVIWVVFALSIDDVGILLTNLFFGALYVYNYVTWKGFKMPQFVGFESDVRRAMGRLRREMRKSEVNTEAVRRLHAQGFFARFENNDTEGPQPGNSVGILREDNGPPPLSRQDFAECTECGALVFADPQNAVEVRVLDFPMVVARHGRNLPSLENMMHVVNYEFYCKRDKLPFDRRDLYPQEDGPTVQEFFKWFPGYDGGDNRIAQVNEDGSPYD